LRIPVNLLSSAASRFCLDKYNVWELAALCQTAAIAVILIIEVHDGPGSKRIFFSLVLVIVTGYAALEMMLSHEWKWQLGASLVFFTGMAFADLLMWFRERDPFQEDLLWRTFLGADIPMIVSNAILLGFLFYDGSEFHRIFFAGATAFGLIFANWLIVLLRIWDIVLRTQHRASNPTT
jgi:hypothetical protein